MLSTPTPQVMSRRAGHWGRHPEEGKGGGGGGGHEFKEGVLAAGLHTAKVWRVIFCSTAVKVCHLGVRGGTT